MRAPLLLVAVSVVALGLVGLVGYDYQATRTELVGLLREQAHALSGTVAAAARSNRASSTLVASQVGERLLDEARSLAALDAKGQLTAAVLAQVSRRNPSLRVGLFDADGSRVNEPGVGLDEPSGGPGGPPGRGPGRGPHGPGRGLRGGGPVVREILEGGRAEYVTDPHSPRWGGGQRMAAGVRRAGGGAIVVTAETAASSGEPSSASLEALLADIAQGSPEIAYMIVEDGSERVAFGLPPEQDDSKGALSGPGFVRTPAPIAGPAERETVVAGRAVMEFTNDLALPGAGLARLRIGLRLDGVRRVEWRMLLRLTASLVAATALVVLAFGLAGLRRRFGVLSEKHALAEEALRRRDRLAAMGELASTVAHEVRNPLNAVGMTAQRLRREFLEAVPEGAADRAELTELLSIMSSETQRIDRIVQQFLDYARPPKLVLVPVDLVGLVTELVERHRALAAARGVGLESAGLVDVEAVVDPALFRQALDNILRNAVEATPEGGTVSLSVGRDGASTIVAIRDTGRGIDADQLPRIFDLYYTTKGDGTGVGLAVTQQIVSGHGGVIEVDSRPGEGTTMIVRLPDGQRSEER